MACKIDIKNTINKSIDNKVDFDFWGYSLSQAKNLTKFINDIWNTNILSYLQRDGRGSYQILKDESKIDEAVEIEYNKQLKAETKIAEIDREINERDLGIDEFGDSNPSYERVDYKNVSYQNSQFKPDNNDINTKYSIENENIKSGVEEVFNENPELANIGTIEQYSQYLDTIFPDSKVKDIVYHGADEKISFFDFIKKKNKNEKGIFFFGKKKSAQLWRDISFEEDNTQQGDLISALINLKNPRVEDFEDKSAWDMQQYVSTKNSSLTKNGKSLLDTTFNKVDNNKAIIYANYLADGEVALKNVLDTIAKLHIYENYNSSLRKKELLREPVKGILQLKQIIEDNLKKGISVEQQVKNKIKELSDFTFYDFLESLLNLTDKGAKLNDKVAKDFKYDKLSSNIRKQIQEDKKKRIKIIENLKESGVDNYNAVLNGEALYNVLEETEVKLSEENIFNNFSKTYRNLLEEQIKEIKENFFIGELSKRGNPTDRNIFNNLTDEFINSFIEEGQESVTVQFLKDLSNETSINAKTANLVRELERRLDILKNKKNGHYLMTVLNLKKYNEKVKDVPANLKPNQDGLIANNVDEMYVGRDTQYAVFEPEQIHILGSKQDIEGFKQFTNNQRQYQKGYINDNLKETEFGIRDLAARLAARIGGNVSFESDLTKDYAGYNEGNSSVINLAKATLDTPIHEIAGHSIIRALKIKSENNINQEIDNMIEKGYIVKKCD